MGTKGISNGVDEHEKGEGSLHVMIPRRARVHGDVQAEYIHFGQGPSAYARLLPTEHITERGVASMAGPDFAQIPDIIAMLNNRTRRQVCEYLAMRPLTMQQLSQYVSVKQPTFSYHMGALFDSKLVTWRFGDEFLYLNQAQVAVLQRYACEVLGDRDAATAKLLATSPLEQLGG